MLVLEPTVRAAGTLFGEPEQALALSLPAATAMVTPALMARTTAESSAEESEPPRLMLATAGFTWLLVTQSTPAMTPALLPDPSQPRTRTGKILARLATPCVVPPTVPATCVPCPAQSVVPLPSLMAV